MRTPRTLLACLVVGLFGPTFGASSAAAAPPPIKGLYWSEGLGAVQLGVDGDRVLGAYQHGGACGFDSSRVVVRGELEGSVFTGSVTLCQSGSGCRERTYPLLALFDPQDQSLTAQVKLEAGCFSPALRGTTLRFEVAGEAERAARPRSLSRPAEARVQRKQEARFRTLATEAILRGDSLLKSGDYNAAAQEFARAVSYQDFNYVAFNGLGVAEFLSGNILSALKAYERAKTLAPTEADTYVNIASVHARLGDRSKALENVRAALRHNLRNPELITHDGDLKRLLGADPEFVKIVSSISGRARGRAP